MGPTFSSIEREVGPVEGGSISTRTSRTKRRMLQSLMLLTRLISGLFRPEGQLPVSLAPQAPERPLSSFHGKATSLYKSRFLPTSCQTTPLPFNYPFSINKLCLIAIIVLTSGPTLDFDDSPTPQRQFRHRFAIDPGTVRLTADSR